MLMITPIFISFQNEEQVAVCFLTNLFKRNILFCIKVNDLLLASFKSGLASPREKKCRMQLKNMTETEIETVKGYN